MISPERRKADIIRNINRNPVELELKQVVKVEKDGYFQEEEKIVSLKVRIYQQKQSEIKVSSDTLGTSYTTRRYGMLADYTAALKVNPKNNIKFNCEYGHMEIKAVYPQIVRGIICGYQCDLERID